MIRLFLGILALLIISAPALAEIIGAPQKTMPPETLMIGVLAEPQSGGEISSKILFVKKGNTWEPVSNENYGSGNVRPPDVKNIKWTVAFDGRSLGELELFDPNPNEKYINPWFFCRDKFFKIKEGQKIPKIANRSGQFGGWMKTPESRPLVLVSRPNFSDPDQWKPVLETGAFRQKLFFPLKLVTGRFNAFRCSDGSEGSQTVPYLFKMEDLMIYNVYSSKNGKTIASIGWNIKTHGCDGVMPEEWSENWFLIDGNDIDFLGREMTLIDAGDYDNDGESELLFWKSGYNEDGYILISDSFTDINPFVWGYH